MLVISTEKLKHDLKPFWPLALFGTFRHALFASSLNNEFQCRVVTFFTEMKAKRKRESNKNI